MGLFLTRAGRSFVEVLASPDEHRLYTTRPDEVAQIEAEEREAQLVLAGEGGDA
jgi:hypothetical protein